MRIAVFAGPTLWNDPLLSARDIEWCAPAAQGDLYRLARTKPFAIGLIDGSFEFVPSVWHKEILWALSRGVHVFGAASMGALRAAELAPFGMIGIGAIFRAYQSGRLSDDDEVAVLHEPRELDYRPLTEAMVDIRATLRCAVAGKVVSQRTASSLLAHAKGMYFKDRAWPRILEEGGHHARLARWLTENRVEQKRKDARAMIRALRQLAKQAPGPNRASFKLSDTQFWRALMAEHA